MRRVIGVMMAGSILLVGCGKESEVPLAQTETVTLQAPAVTVTQTETMTQQPQPVNKIIPVEALETLWVPSLCGNQAANLVGGKLPDSARTISNRAEIKRKPDGIPLGGYTDINGDGRDEAVIAYACDGGGAVGWPDNLLIYDNDLNYLTQFTDWESSGYAPARGHIQAFQWDEDSIQIQWLASAPGDAACCPTRKILGDFTMPSGKPTMTVLTDIPVGR